MAGDEPIIDDINRTSNQPLLSSQIAAMSDGAQQMLTSASGGELVFDPQTGQSLLKTLNDAHDELSAQSDLTFRSHYLDQLGLTAGGRAIAKLNDDATMTGPNAFAPAHQQFVRNLQIAMDAIKIAMDNYARTEQHTAQSFAPGH